MLKKWISISTLALFCSIVDAQSELKIGQWTTHLPFNQAKQIAIGKNTTYYATDYAILRVDQTDFSKEKLTKTSGLSESKIKTIYYHQASASLVIAYQNSLIDIISPRGKIIISDIINFNNIPISKTINSISYADDNHVYVNTDYGCSLIDIYSGRFNFTLFSKNIKYNAITEYNNALYAATSNGIYRFIKNKNTIPEDFSAWEKLNLNHGLPQNNFINVLTHFGKLYVADANNLYQLDANDKFQSLYNDPNYNIQYISAESQHILVGLSCRNNCDNKILLWDEDDLYTEMNNDCTQKNLHALESKDGTIWCADKRGGFRNISPNKECHIIYSNGPYISEFFDILPTLDGVYVSTGGYDNAYTPNYFNNGVMKYKDKNWTYINSENTPIFMTENLHDMLGMAIHPDQNLVYMLSYGGGILEYNIKTKNYQVFDERNSKLEPAIGDPGNVRASAIDFDNKNKKMWITNYLSKNPIVSFDGTVWQSYRLPIAGTELIQIKVDQNGNKWILSRGNSGVYVYNEGDPNNTGDDKSISLNSSNTVIENNKVNCVTVDQDGDVWVGTLNGPVVFECGSEQIFSGTCKGSRRKVDQNGILDLLLKTEEINCIAVDGGNRKWFGTKNGVYVMNAAADVQVHYFNTRNSPLLSNNILDLAIDPKNGDAWIGTEDGIQVYRSEAIEAKDVFTELPNVFPNPVEPDYLGPIAIRGLARDARVKITDITGRLVFENTAEGGQLIWDGKDYEGRDVKSGTYLVFANSTKNFDTAEAAMTKIVIVR